MIKPGEWTRGFIMKEETFLTKDELKKHTGTKQKTKIVDVLKGWEIPFKVKADGWPLVDRVAFFEGVKKCQS